MIKKHITLLLLAFAFACKGPDPETVLISGMVEDPPDQPISLEIRCDVLDQTIQEYDLALDGQNAFSLEFPLTGPTLGTIYFGRQSIPVFFEPGYDLFIHAKASALPEKLFFTGKGSEENNFYHDFIRNEMGQTEGRSFYRLAGQKEAEELMAFLDSLTKHRLLQYEAAGFRSATPFDHHMRGQIKYDKYRMLMEYPEAFRHTNRLGERPTMAPGYYAFLDAPGLFDDRFLSAPHYIRFLTLYLNHVHAHDYEGEVRAESRNKSLFRMAGQLFPPKTAQFQQARIVADALNRSRFEEANALYKAFLERKPAQSYEKAVQKLYKVVYKISPGQLAPDFTLTDLSGEKVSLRDFEGRVIFMDFWASWCVPCIQQLPHARELKSRMREYLDRQELVFLYVSVDTNEEAWRNRVREHQIEGVHLYANGWEMAREQYNVRGVPSYFVIGKDQRVFDNRPPRPSHPDIDKVLRAALQQALE